VAKADDELTRAKWLLWHGNTFRALQVLDDLCSDLGHQQDDRHSPGPELPALLKKLIEFRGYIDANTAYIPNYGERHRCGEAMAFHVPRRASQGDGTSPRLARARHRDHTGPGRSPRPRLAG
jgi:hypothetical protein